MSVALYTIKPGDQLFAIMRSHYGNVAFLHNKTALIERMQKNNPHIANIDMIFPGQVVALPDIIQAKDEMPLLPPPERDATAQVCREIENVDAATRAILSVFDTEKILSTAGGGYIGFVEDATRHAINDVKKVGLSYYQMKAGTISRNQYNYRRNVALTNADAKLGPLRAGFTPGRTAHQAVRIRPQDVTRTSAVLSEIKMLDRTMRLAKSGAVILQVANIANTLNKINTAGTHEERTVIVIDAVSSAAGAAVGAAIAVAIVGTPVGWLAIAGIAAAGATGGFAGEMFGKAVINEVLYDKDGNRLNTQADQVWKSFYAR